MSVPFRADSVLALSGVVLATDADIKPGTFIGTANVPGPGAARELEWELLAKGAHIVAFPGKNAGAVPFIVVGEKGVVPPM